MKVHGLITEMHHHRVDTPNLSLESLSTRALVREAIIQTSQGNTGDVLMHDIYILLGERLGYEVSSLGAFIAIVRGRVHDHVAK